MRRAFGILQAIMIMLLVGGMLTLVLRYARISAKHTADSYLKEEAQLFLDSIVERALLEISATDRSQACWEGNDSYLLEKSGGKRYTGAVYARYYYYDSKESDRCSEANLTRQIQTPESHGYVLLEVEVNATLDGTPVVRLLRRSLQRP